MSVSCSLGRKEVMPVSGGQTDPLVKVEKPFIPYDDG